MPASQHAGIAGPAMSAVTLLTDPEPERHFVQLYDADEELLFANVSHYLSEGLNRGQDILVIATPTHREAICRRLRQLGIDLTAALEGRRAVFLDARETLSALMANGQPDAARFESTIRGTASTLHSGGARSTVRGFGEMVGLLWGDGQISAAVALEELWNRLLAATGYTLFCAYHIDIFGGEFEMAGIDAVLCAHTHLLPGGREGVLDSAINRALHEVFGSELEGLRLLMKANFRPAWAVVPSAEAIILWLRRNLPERADDVLARARRYYHAAQPGPALS
jgi:hypothetical protein